MADSQDIFFSYLRGNNLTRKHQSNTEATFCIHCSVGDERLVKLILLRPVQTTRLFFYVFDKSPCQTALWKSFPAFWPTDWQLWIRSVIIWRHLWSFCLYTSSWVPGELVKEKHCVWGQQFSALKRRNKDRGPVPVCHKEGAIGCPSFSQYQKGRMW